MNNWYIQYRLAKQRHENDIAKAERNLKAYAGQSNGNPQSVKITWYDRLLERMGTAMVNWGARLQSRAACKSLSAASHSTQSIKY